MKHEPLNGARSLRIAPKTESAKTESANAGRACAHLACPPCREPSLCDHGENCPALPAVESVGRFGWTGLACVIAPWAFGGLAVWLWRTLA